MSSRSGQHCKPSSTSKRSNAAKLSDHQEKRRKPRHQYWLPERDTSEERTWAPLEKTKLEPETKLSDSWDELRDMRDIQLDFPFEEHLKAISDHDAGCVHDACPSKFESPAKQECPTTKALEGGDDSDYTSSFETCWSTIYIRRRCSRVWGTQNPHTCCLGACNTDTTNLDVPASYRFTSALISVAHCAA